MRNDWSGQELPHTPGRHWFTGDLAGLDRERPLQSIIEAGAELCAQLCDESKFEKALPPALVALRDFAGDGLFTAYNDEPVWQLAHDLLMPAFTRKAMPRYHAIMLETVDELFATWSADGEPVDVAGDMTKLTMETISRA